MNFRLKNHYFTRSISHYTVNDEAKIVIYFKPFPPFYFEYIEIAPEDLVGENNPFTKYLLDNLSE